MLEMPIYNRGTLLITIVLKTIIRDAWTVSGLYYDRLNMIEQITSVDINFELISNLV